MIIIIRVFIIIVTQILKTSAQLIFKLNKNIYNYVFFSSYYSYQQHPSLKDQKPKERSSDPPLKAKNVPQL